MSISNTGGTSGNNNGSVTSLALPSYTSHSGQDIFVAIVLGSTSSSVSSISTSAGTYGTPTQQTTINGTGIRMELWSIHVTTGAATVFTVNITGGATSIAAALEEYSGVSAEGSTSTNSGSDLYPRQRLTTTQGNNWAVGALGFVTASSTTQTAVSGNSRQASIGASAVGVALYDSTNVGDASLLLMDTLNAPQNWATAAIELQTGNAAITYLDWPAGTGPSLQAAKDFRYLDCLEPLFCQSQTYPPTPGADNYGFVS